MESPFETGLAIAEIEKIYRSELGRLRRVARAIVGDDETARDAVQDAFASAVRTRHRYRADGSPLAWIWQMVVNASISERRRRTRHAADAGSVQPPVAADGNTDELAVRLAAALALVSERQRLVVFLHYYADMDYATISDVLGISPGTVAATLHGARQTMHAALTAEEVQR